MLTGRKTLCRFVRSAPDAHSSLRRLLNVEPAAGSCWKILCCFGLSREFAMEGWNVRNLLYPCPLFQLSFYTLTFVSLSIMQTIDGYILSRPLAVHTLEGLEQTKHVRQTRKNNHHMQNLVAASPEIESLWVPFLWNLSTVSQNHNFRYRSLPWQHKMLHPPSWDPPSAPSNADSCAGSGRTTHREEHHAVWTPMRKAPRLHTSWLDRDGNLDFEKWDALLRLHRSWLILIPSARSPGDQNFFRKEHRSKFVEVSYSPQSNILVADLDHPQNP